MQLLVSFLSHTILWFLNLEMLLSIVRRVLFVCLAVSYGAQGGLKLTM